MGKTQTEYLGEEVSKPPADEPGVKSRGRYTKLLEKCLTKPGSWFLIARYGTPTGAGAVVRRINKGALELPGDNEEGEWESKIVRKNTDDGRISELYMRYVDGEGDEE